MSNWKGSNRAQLGNDWPERRKRVLLRDRYLCVRCKAKGKLTKAEQVHHIVHRSDGGSNDDANLESLCKDCHGEAHGVRVKPRIGLDGWPIE